jgi:GAF domain-containing protein
LYDGLEVQQITLGVSTHLMSDLGLQRITNRLADTLTRDVLVQTTVNNLRNSLQVDRVVLYYFYREWEGRVTFESLSDRKFSIFGTTGPDECFNGEYAAMYEAGRVKAIPDIEIEPIQACHRDFLRNIQVRANLVVPILNSRRLWGLLVAHQCQDTRSWSSSDIETMQKGAKTLATTPSIEDS